MKWTRLPAGLVVAAFQRFMMALGEKADIAVTRINIEAEFASRVASYAIDGVAALPASQMRVREIMGANMFGVGEAIRIFGVNPSLRQLAMLEKVPFLETTLLACKDTHVLVAVFPMSILDIQSKTAKINLPDNQSLFHKSYCYMYGKKSAEDQGELGWQLVRKTPVANSTDKEWQEQQALFDNNEQTPKAQVMVYTIIGHFLATGERLYESVHARCLDSCDGQHVFIGGFHENGLIISHFPDDHRYSSIGVSAVEK